MTLEHKFIFLETKHEPMHTRKISDRFNHANSLNCSCDISITSFFGKGKTRDKNVNSAMRFVKYIVFIFLHDGMRSTSLPLFVYACEILNSMGGISWRHSFSTWMRRSACRASSAMKIDMNFFMLGIFMRFRYKLRLAGKSAFIM